MLVHPFIALQLISKALPNNQTHLCSYVLRISFSWAEPARFILQSHHLPRKTFQIYGVIEGQTRVLTDTLASEAFYFIKCF